MTTIEAAPTDRGAWLTPGTPVVFIRDGLVRSRTTIDRVSTTGDIVFTDPRSPRLRHTDLDSDDVLVRQSSDVDDNSWMVAPADHPIAVEAEVRTRRAVLRRKLYATTRAWTAGANLDRDTAGEDGLVEEIIAAATALRDGLHDPR